MGRFSGLCWMQPVTSGWICGHCHRTCWTFPCSLLGSGNSCYHFTDIAVHVHLCVWGGGGVGEVGGWGKAGEEPGNEATTYVHALPSLIPRLLPSSLSHTIHKTGREPGRYHHVHGRTMCGFGNRIIVHIMRSSRLSPFYVQFATKSWRESWERG